MDHRIKNSLVGIVCGVLVIVPSFVVAETSLQLQIESLQEAVAALQSFDSQSSVLGVTTERGFFTRDLYLYSRGRDVRSLPRDLNANGYVFSQTGDGLPRHESEYVGQKTREAVSRWQQTNKVYPSVGFFGAKSRAKYNALVVSIPTPTPPTGKPPPTTPLPPYSASDRGWDPGLTRRRAALFNTSPGVYFESCPDDPGGCYKNGKGIPQGGGFYTIGQDIGGAVPPPCKINSGALFDVAYADATTRKESCPSYFAWTTDNAGRLAARVTVDTSNWSTAFGPNIYMGFQEGLPYGDVYLGGENIPTIDTAFFGVDLSGFLSILGTDNTSGRIVMGTGWSVPSLGKSYVVELNIGSAVGQSPNPYISLDTPVIINPNCDATTVCLILGGRYWGFPVISNTKTSYAVDWAGIARKLVSRGDLPSAAFGSYPAGGFGAGPEIYGKAKGEVVVSNFRIQSRTNSFRPPPPPPPEHRYASAEPTLSHCPENRRMVAIRSTCLHDVLEQGPGVHAGANLWPNASGSNMAFSSGANRDGPGPAPARATRPAPSLRRAQARRPRPSQHDAPTRESRE